MEEAKYYVAQANAPLNNDGSFSEEFVVCRHSGEVMLAPREQHQPDGRFAEAARVGRCGSHPVPGKRRRQPCSHGLEHAASGRSARSR
ncbi:hypothetical protein Lal_00014464 [Lupinus albus]|nr:hypothetical protein Lal_00014464 [Lupinus albus]